MTLPRLLLVALVLTALTAATVAVVAVLGHEPVPRVAAGGAGRAVPSPADAAGLAVLRGWDARRAAAWSRGDTATLHALYTHASVAGRRDVAMLRAWADRGLRVRGMRMQVLALDARVRRPRRLVLVVTDRLARAVAVGPGVRHPLPRDAPSTRRIDLVRVRRDWRVAAVVPTARPVVRPTPQPAR